MLWDKRTRTPKKDKVAIKEDLKTMTNLIEEAMIYTKDKILKESRETVLRFWLDTKTIEDYYLDVHYDSGMKAWHFSIYTGSGESIGELISEKWPCLQILLDEDVEEEAL